jgi:hypothetical protein
MSHHFILLKLAGYLELSITRIGNTEKPGCLRSNSFSASFIPHLVVPSNMKPEGVKTPEYDMALSGRASSGLQVKLKNGTFFHQKLSVMFILCIALGAFILGGGVIAITNFVAEKGARSY